MENKCRAFIYARKENARTEMSSWITFRISVHKSVTWPMQFVAAAAMISVNALSDAAVQTPFSNSA